ncbi:Ferric reductase, NADH/NADPH oxidase and related proteins [Phaffia rhodozyma]|uniref:Ferric reductase, NADH/NADPH oxidase and related proteins n=1 Tax=Phaffia rhodozyma TaxID=264483 RepID=A0A0F7SJ62_PHARH|nr:Ferric reductase, NADH/NADPH oxidase and related proteins [Phaffia rhodozyma]
MTELPEVDSLIKTLVAPHHGGKESNPNDPARKISIEQHELIDLFSADYQYLFVAICLVLALAHWSPLSLSRVSNKMNARISSVRNFFARNVFIRKWDLRGNRAMVLVWLVWLIYNALSIFYRTNPKIDKKLLRKPHMPVRWVANRAGCLCFANFPVLFILVMRMDYLTWLTSIPVQDFNWFHRWIGWGTFALGMTHVVLYIIWYFLTFRAETWHVFWLSLHQLYWFSGVIATLAFVLLAVLSTKRIRTRCHELFITSHVILSIIFLGACWLHWSPKGIWPLTAAFVFTSSRVHRIVTVTRNGLLIPLLSRWRGSSASTEPLKKTSEVQAIIEPLDEKCVKVRLLVDKNLKWKSGDWVKLHFGNGLGPYQWHPFTITNTPAIQPRIGAEEEGTFKSYSSTSSTPSIHSQSSTLSASSPYSSSSATTLPRITSSDYPLELDPLLARSNETTVQNEMQFIIAAYESLTRKLHDVAPTTVPVLIEGPYGMAHDLKGVDTLILVGGGTGVAYVQSTWEEVIKNEKSTIRKLMVVWSVRERHHFNWLPLQALTQASPSSLMTPQSDLKLHCTSHKPSDGPYVHPETGVNVRAGRPQWNSIIGEGVDQAKGRVLVLVCGPVQLTNAVAEAALNAYDPEKIRQGDLSGDVRVGVELFD